jgi:hypothetical protein
MLSSGRRRVGNRRKEEEKKKRTVTKNKNEYMIKPRNSQAGWWGRAGRGEGRGGHSTGPALYWLSFVSASVHAPEHALPEIQTTC